MTTTHTHTCHSKHTCKQGHGHWPQLTGLEQPPPTMPECVCVCVNVCECVCV
ncbi:MAG: hypothetical protein P4L40_18500 [Terracidiphilus sp.]|nr:hypothetical protein [Terracidiphilus sp.]